MHLLVELTNEELITLKRLLEIELLNRIEHWPKPRQEQLSKIDDKLNQLIKDWDVR